MLSIHKNRKQSGFTIIEVMIVLAIAALILLVVLLAVPALQRNARNTAMKNDAGNVAAAIATYSSNNNGTVPTYGGGTGSTAFVGTSATDANKETIKLQGSTTLTSTGTVPSGIGVGATNKTAIGTILVVKGKDCSNASSPRAYQLWYVSEVSGGTNQQCQDTSS